MTEQSLAVLDSSVGVKWIKPEAGRAAALGLLAQHRDGAIRIVVASHFVTEVVAVAVRHGGAELGQSAWRNLVLAELTVISIDEALVREALRQVRALGTSFYDALPAALARLLGATLYSADARAHREFPEVVLLGEDEADATPTA